MKKIKLFALAAFAMLSTNLYAAYAVDNVFGTTEFNCKVTAVGTATTPATVNIVGFAGEYPVASMASLEIPATVTDPEGKSYTVIGIGEEAFKGNTNITSLAFKTGNGVTTIGASAFAGCSNLATATFTNATALTTIGEYAFAGTKITSFNISATKVVTVNRLFTKDAVAAAGSTPAQPALTSVLESVSLPAATQLIVGNAFIDCTALNSVTFAALAAGKANVSEIGAFAFKNTNLTSLDLTSTKLLILNELFETTNTKVTEVKLPATLTQVGANAFEGLSKLTSVDFSACAANYTIGASAFKNTMVLETLSLNKFFGGFAENALAGSYIKTLNIVANATEGKPVINATGATKLVTLNVDPATDVKVFKGNFAAGAFATAATLTTVNFNVNLWHRDAAAAVAAKKYSEYYDTDGEAGLSEAETAAMNAAIIAYNASLELALHETTALTAIEAALYNSVMSGEATAKAKGDALSANEANAYNAKLDGAVTEDSYVEGSAKEAVTEMSAVSGGAFAMNGSQTITVTYRPTTIYKADGTTVDVDYQAMKSFANNAFAASGADPYVTFNTTYNFSQFYSTTGTGGALYGVTMNGGAAPTEEVESTGTIPMLAKTGTTPSYYYNTFIATANVKIPKIQDKAKVMVYGAYVDQYEGEVAIMMDQLHLINGFYYLPAGSAVIVKSSTNTAVNFYEGDASKDSRNYKRSSTNLQSEIHYFGDNYVSEGANPADSYAVTVKEAGAVAGGTVYFVAPIEEYGFTWAKFKDDRIIKKNQFYVVAPAAAAAARVIWLDGSEEDQTTAIQDVKAVSVVNDAIYNLAGQKVNASYKGVVIKNGKKMIQK